jgi:hypothetical protein
MSLGAPQIAMLLAERSLNLVDGILPFGFGLALPVHQESLPADAAMHLRITFRAFT